MPIANCRFAVADRFADGPINKTVSTKSVFAMGNGKRQSEFGYRLMNLVGLILIAALSGVIVAVSLRLRASGSSEGMLIDRERLPKED